MPQKTKMTARLTGTSIETSRMASISKNIASSRVQRTSLTEIFTINFVWPCRELESGDSTESHGKMSVGEQGSVFGDSWSVEIMDKVPFGNDDNDYGESGTE